MTTERLIERLVRDLEPVRPLPSPAVRAARAVAGVVGFVLIVALPLTTATDIAMNAGGGVWFVAPHVLSLLTGLFAIVAAFASVVPGYSRRLWMWPAASLAIWVAMLAFAGRTQWTVPADPSLPSEWVCLALIVGSGAPIMVVLLRQLRQGAVFNAALTAALAALAVTSFASIGACLSHPHTNYALMLIWHGAAFVALTLCSALLAPRLFAVTSLPAQQSHIRDLRNRRRVENGHLR